MNGMNDDNILAALASLQLKKSQIAPPPMENDETMNARKLEEDSNARLFQGNNSQPVTEAAPPIDGNQEALMSRKLAAVTKLSGATPVDNSPVPPMAPTKPNDIYGEDLNDDALKAAQAQGNSQRQMAGIMRAVETLGQGFTNGRVKADNGFADAMDKNAAQGVTDINDRRSAKDKEIARQKTLLEMNDETAMRDPKSPVSISIRDGLKTMFPQMSLPENVSAKQLKDLGINYGTLVAAKEAAEARKAAAGLAADAKSEARNDKKEREAKLSDKQVEGVNEFDDSLNKMQTAVSSLGKNSNWVGMGDNLVPNMLVGDDQVAFRSAVGRMEDAYRKLITGAGATNKELARLASRLPSVSDTYDNFQSKAKGFIEELKKARQTHLSNYEKQGKNVNSFKSGDEAATVDHSSDERIDTFMKKNGIKDRDEAIKILKENGKI